MRTWPVIGYPQPGKEKSERLLVAFVCGAAGYVQPAARAQLVDRTAAAFYGVIGLEELFRRAERRAAAGGGDFYYLDNAYFDRARQRYFRVARNALQRAAVWPAWDRLEDLGIKVRPWQTGGRHIVIVEQSDHFMRHVAGWPDGAAGWRRQVLEILKRATDRPLQLRPWLADKRQASSSLAQDLAGAFALVTHSSAAANEALLAGVPVFATGDCVAAELGLRDLSLLESPLRLEGRAEWAARLAGAQWTEEEMRRGKVWRALERDVEVAL